MEELNIITYEEVRAERRRENAIDAVLTGFIGAGIMSIIVILMLSFPI
jgi:hypothetical protein